MAIALTNWNYGLIPSILLTIAIGVAIGIFYGTFIAYANIPAFIVTLGGLPAWRGANKGISKSETIPVSDAAFKSIGQSYIAVKIGWVIAAAAILFVLAIGLRRAQTQKTFGLGKANFERRQSL